MKLCVAQTRPVKGDIEANIQKHVKLIEVAVVHGADTIVFPELSLTGYEPQLANDLSIHISDSRLDIFQQISDKHKITIGVGVPTKSGNGINITMIVFLPHAAREWYAKKYLHADEEDLFTSGKGSITTIGNNEKVALAICYELSVAEHAENAFRKGAQFYIASVAKTTAGAEKAIERLSAIAGHYSMTVLMSNCIGPCDGAEGGGRTSIWNSRGLLVAQLDDIHEGILLINTDTGDVIKKTI